MSQPPFPPTPVNPHDDNVTDDSLLRPITAPPERDRVQAMLGNHDITPEVAEEIASSSSRNLPVLPLVVATVIILLLVWWVM